MSNEGKLITDIIADAMTSLGALRDWCEGTFPAPRKDPPVFQRYNKLTPPHNCVFTDHERLRSAQLEASANARIAMLESYLSDSRRKIEELRKDNDGLRAQARALKEILGVCS